MGIKAIIASAIVLVTGCSAGVYLGYLPNPLDSKMERACELALKSRLKSPSGYHRVNISSYDKSINVGDVIGSMIKDRESDSNIETYRSEAQKRPVQPKLFQLFIEYDAPNSYGTPIRDVAECTYISKYDGSVEEVEEWNVKIDGETRVQRAMRILKDG